MYLINKELMFLGKPIELYNICKVYPLTVGEILCDLGQDKYRHYLNLLTLDKESIEEALKQKGIEEEITQTPLEYLLECALNDDMFFLDLTDAFSTFIREKVLLLPQTKSISIGDISERNLITNENFKDFQDILRAQNNIPIKVEPPENENFMQKKFRLKREERERVKAKQAIKNGQGIDLFVQLSSLCAAGIGVTIESIEKFSLYTIKELLDRTQAKEQYNLEMRMIIAGADSKKVKAQHWVRNLENNNK